MDRQKMIDEVIKNNGFENKWTIWFCELAENIHVPDSVLKNAMICAIIMPMVKNHLDNSL